MVRYDRVFALLVVTVLTSVISTQVFVANAQPPIPPIITMDNAGLLGVAGVAGRGKPNRAGWSPDGHTFAVASASALWVYTADSMDTPPIPISHFGPVLDMAFSQDSQSIMWINRKLGGGIANLKQHKIRAEIPQGGLGPEI